jgi:hypothetical protein
MSILLNRVPHTAVDQEDALKTSSRIRRASLTLGSAVALVIAFPGSALADPPTALPANAEGLEQTYQPAYDYDTDGCYPTPAIGPDGTLNGGLKPGGAINGQCRDSWDLDNTNGYARYKCNNGWCAIMYGLYFEKDQAVAGSGLGGHRHDWEHVVLWVQNNEAKYVSTSAHGGFTTYSRDQIRWDGTHPKIVYHKDGASTHAFRFAKWGEVPHAWGNGTWDTPALVTMQRMADAPRNALWNSQWGKANFPLTGNLQSNINKARDADGRAQSAIPAF